MEENKAKILVVDEWETPVSAYPEKRVRKARIKKAVYNEGLYYMEGVCGFDFFMVKKPITITVLQVKSRGGWGDVMVDDPLHAIGMAELAKASKGRVLVAGLGLGLILHYLDRNESVTSVDVVEINKDVIRLIKPLLPEFKYDFRIIRQGFFDYITYKCKEEYDTVILDLWVGMGSEAMFLEMLGAHSLVKERLPHSNVYVWGVGKPDLNPAVKKEPIYWRALREGVWR